MFKENKYTKVYYRIIQRALFDKSMIVLDYHEEHHIIPKCLGGKDSSDNLVCLTAKQHFVCHLLLTKMHDSPKLKYALVSLTLNNPFQSRLKISGRIYEYVRKCNSIATSERCKGKQKHNLGKKIYHDPVTLQERFVVESDDISGLVKGFSPTRKENVGRANKGKVYYHDPVSKHTIAVNDGVEIPEGYVKGNPNADNGIKNIDKKYYHDPKNGKNVREFQCPLGYVEGSCFNYYNNGIESKMFNVITDVIPEGWNKGRIIKWELVKGKKKK